MVIFNTKKQEDQSQNDHDLLLRSICSTFGWDMPAKSNFKI